jgi:hypothetical protein
LFDALAVAFALAALLFDTCVGAVCSFEFFRAGEMPAACDTALFAACAGFGAFEVSFANHASCAFFVVLWAEAGDVIAVAVVGLCGGEWLEVFESLALEGCGVVGLGLFGCFGDTICVAYVLTFPARIDANGSLCTGLGTKLFICGADDPFFAAVGCRTMFDAVIAAIWAYFCATIDDTIAKCLPAL